MSAQIRKLVVQVDETRIEQGQTVQPSTRRAVAMAVIANPYAGRYSQNLDELIAIGEELGQLLGDAHSTVLVGLLDDASATLVLDMVRSAGGRILSEQTHRIGGDATAWAQALGQALALGQPVPAVPVAAGAPARVAFRCLI